MPLIQVKNRNVQVDSSGFLVNTADWDRDVAVVLASNTMLGTLSEAHWRVILFVRDYYERYENAPMLRTITKRTRLGEKTLRTLFPSACRECMCKIAGLPQPTG